MASQEPADQLLEKLEEIAEKRFLLNNHPALEVGGDLPEQRSKVLEKISEKVQEVKAELAGLLADCETAERLASALEQRIGEKEMPEPASRGWFYDQPEEVYVRQEYLEALKRLGEEARAVGVLLGVLRDRDRQGAPLRRAYADLIADPTPYPAVYVPSSEPREYTLSLARAWTSAAAPALAEAARSDDYEPSVRLACVQALGAIGGEALDALLAAVERLPDGQWDLLFACASALGDSGEQRLVDPLIEILCSDGSFKRFASAQALRKISQDWRFKAGRIVSYLNTHRLDRSRVHAPEILAAIAPPDGGEGSAEEGGAGGLTDLLIGKALEFSTDERMTQNLAKLLVQSTGDSPEEAGRRINRYQEREGPEKGKLRRLRIATGGETALHSVMATLQRNLDENFQEPISRLNDESLATWQRTIKDARYGFVARITMSVVLFVVGIILLMTSAYQIIFGDLSTEQFFGPGVSFVSGLGTMLLIIYTGPLKEIRLSVNDLGISNAAFIAYIHRVLEVSHTFSYYYLQQRITFDEMKRSSDLIDEAMSATVRALLSNKGGEGAAKQLAKTLAED